MQALEHLLVVLSESLYGHRKQKQTYEPSILRASHSVQSIAFPEGPDISFDSSFLQPTASTHSSKEQSRLSTIDESPSSESSPAITYSSSSSRSLTPTAIVESVSASSPSLLLQSPPLHLHYRSRLPRWCAIRPYPPPPPTSLLMLPRSTPSWPHLCSISMYKFVVIMSHRFLNSIQVLRNLIHRTSDTSETVSFDSELCAPSSLPCRRPTPCPSQPPFRLL